MTNIEINTFIEEMDNLNDHWEYEDVKRVYGNQSLEDALSDRRASISHMNDILAKVSLQ